MTRFKLQHDPRFIFSATVLIIILAIALLAPLIASGDIQDSDITLRLLPPSLHSLFGRDLFGGDLFSQAVYGAQTTAFIGFGTLTICVSIGSMAGLLAGYFGGWIDQLVMRIIDVLMSFPGILLAMALAAFLGPNTYNIIISISVTGWTGVARLVRGQVLSLREKDYIVAARALGLGNRRIMFKHLLPNVASPLLVLATFNLAGIILIEASLSFLGLGAQDSHPSWGSLLNQGRTVLIEAPHLSLIPGFLIMVVVLSINLLGDCLRDYFDPKTR